MLLERLASLEEERGTILHLLQERQVPAPAGAGAVATRPLGPDEGNWLSAARRPRRGAPVRGPLTNEEFDEWTAKQVAVIVERHVKADAIAADRTLEELVTAIGVAVHQANWKMKTDFEMEGQCLRAHLLSRVAIRAEVSICSDATTGAPHLIGEPGHSKTAAKYTRLYEFGISKKLLKCYISNLQRENWLINNIEAWRRFDEEHAAEGPVEHVHLNAEFEEVRAHTAPLHQLLSAILALKAAVQRREDAFKRRRHLFAFRK